MPPTNTHISLINIYAVFQVMTKDMLLADHDMNTDSEDYTNDPLDRALQQFLGKSTDEIRNTIKATLEGHLRAILGTMTVEEIYREREEFALKVRHTAAPDLKKMGLQILSFTIKDVTDKVEYLDSLGKTRIQEVKSQAAIGKVCHLHIVLVCCCPNTTLCGRIDTNPQSSTSLVI